MTDPGTVGKAVPRQNLTTHGTKTIEKIIDSTTLKSSDVLSTEYHVELRFTEETNKVTALKCGIGKKGPFEHPVTLGDPATATEDKVKAED